MFRKEMFRTETFLKETSGLFLKKRAASSRAPDAEIFRVSPCAKASADPIRAASANFGRARHGSC